MQKVNSIRYLYGSVGQPSRNITIDNNVQLILVYTNISWRQLPNKTKRVDLTKSSRPKCRPHLELKCAFQIGVLRAFCASPSGQ